MKKRFDKLPPPSLLKQSSFIKEARKNPTRFQRLGFLRFLSLAISLPPSKRPVKIVSAFCTKLSSLLTLVGAIGAIGLSLFTPTGFVWAQQQNAPSQTIEIPSVQSAIERLEVFVLRSLRFTENDAWREAYLKIDPPTDEEEALISSPPEDAFDSSINAENQTARLRIRQQSFNFDNLTEFVDGVVAERISDMNQDNSILMTSDLNLNQDVRLDLIRPSRSQAYQMDMISNNRARRVRANSAVFSNVISPNLTADTINGSAVITDSNISDYLVTSIFSQTSRINWNTDPYLYTVRDQSVGSLTLHMRHRDVAFENVSALQTIFASTIEANNINATRTVADIVTLKKGEVLQAGDANGVINSLSGLDQQALQSVTSGELNAQLITAPSSGQLVINVSDHGLVTQLNVLSGVANAETVFTQSILAEDISTQQISIREMTPETGGPTTFDTNNTAGSGEMNLASDIEVEVYGTATFEVSPSDGARADSLTMNESAIDGSNLNQMGFNFGSGDAQVGGNVMADSLYMNGGFLQVSDLRVYGNRIESESGVTFGLNGFDLTDTFSFSSDPSRVRALASLTTLGIRTDNRINFQNSQNSTHAFSFWYSDSSDGGNSVLNIDTVNQSVYIGEAFNNENFDQNTSQYELYVDGTLAVNAIADEAPPVEFWGVASENDVDIIRIQDINNDDPSDDEASNVETAITFQFGTTPNAVPTVSALEARANFEGDESVLIGTLQSSWDSQSDFAFGVATATNGLLLEVNDLGETSIAYDLVTSGATTFTHNLALGDDTNDSLRINVNLGEGADNGLRFIAGDENSVRGLVFIDGAFRFNDNLEVTDTLSVGSLFTLATRVSGDFFSGSDFSVENLNLDSALFPSVTSTRVEVAGTFAVTSSATLRGSTTFNEDVTIAGGLTVGGKTQVSNLTVSNQATFGQAGNGVTSVLSEEVLNLTNLELGLRNTDTATFGQSLGIEGTLTVGDENQSNNVVLGSDGAGVYLNAVQLSGSSAFEGNITFANNVFEDALIIEEAQANDTLEVTVFMTTGSLVSQGDGAIRGELEIGQDLAVAGDMTLTQGNFFTGGFASIGGGLFLSDDGSGNEGNFSTQNLVQTNSDATLNLNQLLVQSQDEFGNILMNGGTTVRSVFKGGASFIGDITFEAPLTTTNIGVVGTGVAELSDLIIVNEPTIGTAIMQGDMRISQDLNGGTTSASNLGNLHVLNGNAASIALDISGDLTILGNLSAQDTTFNGTLNVTQGGSVGSLNVTNGNLIAGGIDGIFDGFLNLSQALTLGGVHNLVVGGSADIAGSLTVDGASIAGNLLTSGAMSVGGDLVQNLQAISQFGQFNESSFNSSSNGSVVITGNLTTLNQPHVSGIANFIGGNLYLGDGDDTIYVSGRSTVQQRFEPEGSNTTFDVNGIGAYGGLTNSGFATMQNVVIQPNFLFEVSQDSSVNFAQFETSSNSSATIVSFEVAGITTISGDLRYTGDELRINRLHSADNPQGEFNISGNTTLNSTSIDNLKVNELASIGGNLVVNSDSSFCSSENTVSTIGSSLIPSTLSIAQGLSISGTLTLGNLIASNASIAGDLILNQSVSLGTGVHSGSFAVGALGLGGSAGP